MKRVICLRRCLNRSFRMINFENKLQLLYIKFKYVRRRFVFNFIVHFKRNRTVVACHYNDFYKITAKCC